MRSVAQILFVCLGISFLDGLVVAQTTRTERIATGITRPVFAVSPPGDMDRLFIVEQHTGRIEILDLNTNTISPTAFLTVSGLATGNEQGLLGLAFDPDYANNGYFYVNLTTSADSGTTHIRRYQAQGDPATSNIANAGSAFQILSFSQPQSNHNGGWIDFGPNDGYLYIASGDGGGGNDNEGGHTPGTGNAQDTTNNLLGKMLRIDVHGDDFPADNSRNYAIPDDNPFVGVTGDDEIWSYGLRNPYRASFDRANGDMWIGDVGQVAREEINYQPASSTGGENYGWRLREGTIATPSGGVGGPPPPGNVEPIYDYTRGTGALQGNVVIGGYVYRGPVREFQGHYIFADGGSHHIWKLDPDAVNPRASVRRINPSLIPNAGSIANIGSFGEDAAGNLYIMEFFGGELFRIASTSQSIVWNGDDAAAGAAGDGTSWGDSENWTRAGVPDAAFVPNDHVIFAAGSSQATINLGATRAVSAATFEAPYTLAGNILRVLSGNVTVESGVTATIESALQSETVDHSIRKLGEGTLLIEGTAYQTSVKEGTLGGTGTLSHLTVRDGGTVAPGASTGTLNVTSSFTMHAGSTLAIELGGSEPAQFDSLDVTSGAATLAGLLSVSLIDPTGGSDIFQPALGDSFEILTATGGVNSTFAEALLPDLGPNMAMRAFYSADAVTLAVVPALAGDYNGDGVVDAADYTVWRDSNGAMGPGLFADGTGQGGSPDGVVDEQDYEFWRANFGGVAGTAENIGDTVVPEPASWILALIFAAVHHRLRNRTDYLQNR